MIKTRKERQNTNLTMIKVHVYRCEFVTLSIKVLKKIINQIKKNICKTIRKKKKYACVEIKLKIFMFFRRCYFGQYHKAEIFNPFLLIECYDYKCVKKEMCSTYTLNIFFSVL